MFATKFFFVTIFFLTTGADEHATERQKIADKMREGFLMISLKDLLALPRLLRRKFFWGIFKCGEF
jgi:hypothetical protein